jgi:hypothetical protein
MVRFDVSSDSVVTGMIVLCGNVTVGNNVMRNLYAEAVKARESDSR